MQPKNPKLKETLLIQHNLAGRIQQESNQRKDKVIRYKTQLTKHKLRHIKSHRRKDRNYNKFYQYLRLNLCKNVK